MLEKDWKEIESRAEIKYSLDSKPVKMKYVGMTAGTRDQQQDLNEDLVYPRNNDNKIKMKEKTSDER